MVINCIPDEDKLNTTADYEQSEFKCLLCQQKLRIRSALKI